MKNTVLMAMIAFVLLMFVSTKQAEANDILRFISGTYSHRNFTTGQVSDEMIQQILAAGHQAGSAGNQQHWHFSVVRNRALINEILPNVHDGNVLILGLGPNQSRFHQDIIVFDNGLALQNMFLAAQSLGLGTRMYLSPLPHLSANLLPRLGAPENHRVIMVLRIGHITPPDATSQASPRQPLASRVNYIN